MKICAAYVVANEEANIGESLRSVKAYVDEFIVIDSVFVSNPLTSTHSTDHTREMAQHVCGSALNYWASDRKLTEIEARGRYLAAVEPGDWLFVIDGDEVLIGNHRSICDWFDQIRAGSLDEDELLVSVYTTAVLVPKKAPDITPLEYGTAPLVASLGQMPRLVRARKGLGYLDLGGRSAPALAVNGKALDPTVSVPVADFHLVNYHTHQTYREYLLDYEWETKA